MRLPEVVRDALARLEAAGYPAYVVGGAVRDHLRGVMPTAAIPMPYGSCAWSRPTSPGGISP